MEDRRWERESEGGVEVVVVAGERVINGGTVVCVIVVGGINRGAGFESSNPVFGL